VATLMRPPFSRMDVLSQSEIDTVIRQSALVKEYNIDLDRTSAFEMLQERMEQRLEQEEAQQQAEERIRNEQIDAHKEPTRSRSSSGRTQKSTFEQVLKSPVTNMIARELTRGLLGVLGIKR